MRAVLTIQLLACAIILPACSSTNSSFQKTGQAQIWSSTLMWEARLGQTSRCMDGTNYFQKQGKRKTVLDKSMLAPRKASAKRGVRLVWVRAGSSTVGVNKKAQAVAQALSAAHPNWRQIDVLPNKTVVYTDRRAYVSGESESFVRRCYQDEARGKRQAAIQAALRKYLERQ